VPRAIGAWALCLVVALSWALTIGRYGGPDEPAHVVRAAAVARGVLIGSPAVDLEPGYRVVEVPRSIASGDPSCYRHDPDADASCAVASDRTDLVAAATSAGTFPPTYYAAVGAVARVAGVGDDALGHRVVAALAVALVLALAYGRLRAWPDRTGAGLVWAGLTPAAWFLTGVVNTNGLEVALLVLAWVLTAELLGGGRTASIDVGRHLAALGLIGATVVLIRPVAVTGVVTVAATLAVGLAPDQRPHWRSRSVAGAVAAVLAAAVLVGAWWAAVGLVVRDSRTAGDIDGSIVLAALRGIDDTVAEAVSSLGWAEYSAPLPAVLIWCSVAAVAISALAIGGDRRLRRAAVVGAAATVLLPVVFEIVTARRIGHVWQGRYSIGALIGLAALGAVALPDRLRRIASALPLLAAAGSTLTLWAAARRYISGADGPWWFDRTSGWWPPAGPWLPLAAHAAASVALAAGLTVDRRAGALDPLRAAT
jgi:hypothetical protein